MNEMPTADKKGNYLKIMRIVLTWNILSRTEQIVPLEYL